MIKHTRQLERWLCRAARAASKWDILREATAEQKISRRLATLAGFFVGISHLSSKRHASQMTRLHDRLLDCWQKCKEPNWDGYDAYEVEQATYQNTHRFVISLPPGCLPHSVGAEPDGHLTLEWYRRPRWTLSVSIGPDGALHYAALLGTDSPHGYIPFFGETPVSVLALIHSVLYNAPEAG